HRGGRIRATHYRGGRCGNGDASTRRRPATLQSATASGVGDARTAVLTATDVLIEHHTRVDALAGCLGLMKLFPTDLPAILARLPFWAVVVAASEVVPQLRRASLGALLRDGRRADEAKYCECCCGRECSHHVSVPPRGRMARQASTPRRSLASSAPAR